MNSADCCLEGITMAQESIVAFGTGAAIPLSPQILESLGVQIGDPIEMIVTDGQVVLRPVAGQVRRELLERITREVFEERGAAYQRLA